MGTKFSSFWKGLEYRKHYCCCCCDDDNKAITVTDAVNLATNNTGGSNKPRAKGNAEVNKDNNSNDLANKVS